MKSTNQVKIKNSAQGKTIIRRCHLCGHIMENIEEPKQCDHCRKSFLPLNYFSKIHNKTDLQFFSLFESAQEIHEEDLIKGLLVLW